MNFTWDENKNQTNIHKHGIDFNDIYRVFNGPIVARVDDREVYDEIRWKCTGYLGSIVVIVIYVEIEEETIRIISARKALKNERKWFEQKLKN